MITEDYCSYEVAKLLKEKGFDIVCWCFYSSGGTDYKRHEVVPYSNKELPPYQYSCPTQQMAMKWLRKEHKLYIDSFVTYKNDISHYQWRIENLKTKDTIVETPSYDELEEAIEAAILYCLKNLI